MNSVDALAERTMARIDRLARITAVEGILTRSYLTAEHRQANDLVGQWMREAGMHVREDEAGNIIGRYEGKEDNAPCVMLGSHLDTVVNAGRYDGMLGVLAAIACVEELQERGRRFDFALEVVGFGDEEGVRFGTTYLGSRAIAGTTDPAVFDAQDQDGVSLRQALNDFGKTGDFSAAARKPSELLAFLEFHIEQGPVLEAAGLPVGTVTAINGQARLSVELTGEAGHAGTVPMALRRDALAAAAEAISQVEGICSREKDVVGTVGILEVPNGAINVIPGQVRFTIDLRAADNDLRQRLEGELIAAIHDASTKRSVTATVKKLHQADSVACNARLMDLIDAAISEAGHRPMRLPSGAGHDAAAMSDLTDVGMVFLRCEKGISHNPAEAVSLADVAVGIEVLSILLEKIGSAEYE